MLVIGRVVASVRRASLEPMLVRVGGFAAGLAALLLASPAGLPRPVVAMLAVLAALPAVFPRGPWVTVVVLAAVVGWVAETGTWAVAGTSAETDTVVVGSTGLAGVVPDPGRAVLLAGLLYLLHTLTALAAALPFDAVVASEVLTQWLLRALGVVLCSVLVSAAVLAGLSQLPDGRIYAAAPLVGLAVAIAVAAVLRRRHHHRHRLSSR